MATQSQADRNKAAGDFSHLGGSNLDTPRSGNILDQNAETSRQAGAHKSGTRVVDRRAIKKEAMRKQATESLASWMAQTAAHKQTAAGAAIGAQNQDREREAAVSIHTQAVPAEPARSPAPLSPQERGETPRPFPTGCPYDFIPALSGSSAVFSSVKYDGCSPKGSVVNYAAQAVDETSASHYGYTDTGAWNYLAKVDDTSAFVRVYDDTSFAALNVQESEASVYGYANETSWNFLMKAASAEASLELFSSSEDGYAELYATSGNAGVSVSNGDDIFSTMEPSSLLLKENDNQTNLWSEGLTITDGTNTISMLLSETDGKDVAFREIERCDGKKARVLMTDWY